VVLILAAGILNAGLGYYLIRIGKEHTPILEADGKHVLTDSWTSIGVVLGLGLCCSRTGNPLTRWSPLQWPSTSYGQAAVCFGDPPRACLILRPEAGRRIRARLDAICTDLNLQYHGVRFRTTGYRHLIEVHLLFPSLTHVGEAHALAQRWKNA